MEHIIPNTARAIAILFARFCSPTGCRCSHTSRTVGRTGESRSQVKMQRRYGSSIRAKKQEYDPDSDSFLGLPCLNYIVGIIKMDSTLLLSKRICPGLWRWGWRPHTPYWSLSSEAGWWCVWGFSGVLKEVASEMQRLKTFHDFPIDSSPQKWHVNTCTSMGVTYMNGARQPAPPRLAILLICSWYRTELFSNGEHIERLSFEGSMTM